MEFLTTEDLHMNINELVLVIWFETLGIRRTPENILRIYIQTRDCAKRFPSTYLQKVKMAEQMHRAFVRAELRTVNIA